MTGIDDAALLRIEKQYASGLSSVQILDVFATHGVPLSEATLRKYVQLGLLPRFEVRYTSATHAGQIYLPRVNVLLLIGVLLLVGLFDSDLDGRGIQRGHLWWRHAPA